MANNVKSYKVIADVGVVGFNGVIHGHGDIITSETAPSANIKAWLRFKQIEEVKEEAPAAEEAPAKEKGKK